MPVRGSRAGPSVKARAEDPRCAPERMASQHRADGPVPSQSTSDLRKPHHRAPVMGALAKVQHEDRDPNFPEWRQWIIREEVIGHRTHESAARAAQR